MRYMRSFDFSAVHFLEQLSREIKELQARLGRHFYIIAENDRNEIRPVQPYETGGYGIDAQWNEDCHHALHTVLTGEKDGYYADFGTLEDLAKVLSKGFAQDGRYSIFRGRNHGRPAHELSGHRFVAYLQNHDQIGNRARGDRITHLVNMKKAKIGAALIFTSAFIPLIFQGEEWGSSNPFLYFSDHEDPALANAIREGRRAEFSGFGWDPSEIPDPQALETFRLSCLNWKELVDKQHADLLAWYKQVIKLRKELPGLTSGHLDRIAVSFNEAQKWLVMKNGSVSVACNIDGQGHEVDLGSDSLQHLILASDDGIFLKENRIYLPGESAAILIDAQGQGGSH